VPWHQSRVCGSRQRSALLEIGDAQALIFTKVDRASHCTEDFARPIRLSEEQGWRLIVTEMGIDNAIGGSARRARPRTPLPAT
jgi:hypothetical protein